ncbi:MAG: ComEA family DNA-binding protein [Luteimonas sp.]|nr:ComEA family DNA-binding protein [Luteimonas sp.]
MHTFRKLVATLLLSVLFVGSALATEKVNINTADAATLERVLVNIGPAKAQAIVEYRQANGAFRSAEQLAQVKGIGLKTVERNLDRIEVGGSNPPARSSQTGAAPPAQSRAQQQR